MAFSHADVEAATINTWSDELGNGQGVIVSGDFVLTAAHCIDDVPHGCAATGAKCYHTIRRGGNESFGQPVALDPFADIAALACPDEDCDRFGELIDTPPVTLYRGPIDQPMRLFIRSHEGFWIAASYKPIDSLAPPQGRTFVMSDQYVKFGTSGGPVVTERGELFGLVSVASEKPDTAGDSAGQYCVQLAVPQFALPRWVLDNIIASE